ncbi:MAG: hypothetical protein HKN44_13840 [Ilumatobacter sp.]|nr:hypothetical protein [Ilumatobacter sp.]
MSAPFQLAPPPRSFLPLQPRAATIEWPAPEPVALRRSNEWPAPDLTTMAWADAAFEPVFEVAVPSLRQTLAPPASRGPQLAPPSTISAPMALPAPASPVAPVAAMLAPPAPAPAAAMLAPPAPVARPLDPPMRTAATLPAPSTTLAPPDTAPDDLQLLAPPAPDTLVATPEAAGGRKRIIRLQDAIITLSVAAATALITLVLLSQL